MTPVYIRASGLLTPVGFNSRATCAAIRAGIKGVKAANLWDPEAAEYISAGRVPLPQWWEGPTKLPALIAPAIHECLQSAPNVTPEEIPVLLAVASPDRPQYPKAIVDSLLPEIGQILGIRLHSDSMIIPRSQVSVASAIQQAAEWFRDRGIRYCVIAGVESLLQQKIVEFYMQFRRVMTPGNSNGFFPGEAGTALLVASSPQPGDLGIHGVGFGHESATIESDRPFRAKGMTEAIENAFTLAGCDIESVDYRITDLNGEHYKFKEAAFVSNRFHRRPRKTFFDLWHPTEYLGEIGAALGPCALAVAHDAAKRSWVPGPGVLCHLSNDNGERAAIVARLESGRRQYG